MHYLYTFDQCGQFTIRSNRFDETATVIVYSDDVIRNESKFSFKCFICIDDWYVEKRVPAPQLIEDIDTVSQYGIEVHLKCANQDATIFYTLDGTLPTRHFDNVHVTKKELEFFNFD